MKRFFIRGICVLGTGLAACGGQSSEIPSVSVVEAQPLPPSPLISPLIFFGAFQGKYIAAQARLIVEPLSSKISTPPSHTESADPDTQLPSSATGIPTPNPPGGVIAYSPAGGSYSGVCPGTEPNRYCGPVRLVNRYSEGGVPTTLRNVYAAITSITPGYSQVSSTRNTFGDSDRSAEFGAAVTSANGGLWYYGHLSPSNYPLPTLQPGIDEDNDTGGFRVDRIWSFTGPGGDFAFTFEVYGHPVACAFAAGTIEDPYNTPLSDRNCDGVVAGSRSQGVFVANGTFANGAPRGNDTTGLGTLRRPVATIKRGLDIQGANPSRTGVYSAASTFNEISLLNIKTTPQWLGGFDSDNGFGRNSSASTAVVSSQGVAVGRVSSAIATLMQSISVQSANGSTLFSGIGASSLVMVVSHSPALLTLDQVALHAGLGGAGNNGAMGAMGRVGNDGTAGSSATLGSGGTAGGICLFGGTPGAGGSGSANTMPDPFVTSPDGVNGMSSSSGALGGGGGAGGDPDFCSPGVQSNGGTGGGAQLGQNGSNGAAAPAFSGSLLTAGGTYNALLASGNAGASNGLPGAGGGGGGAGGAMDNDGLCSGNTSAGGGGGGAGAGGCGSGVGGKGFGGGASFGISILDAAVALRNVSIITDGGGRGGNGGAGGGHGAGGIGKAGGTTTSTFGFMSSGGTGSNGGDGGHGGNASGGNGGPSFCWVVELGSTVTETTPLTCTFGAGGIRGVGGSADPTQPPGGAANGQTGPAAIRFDY